jgi:hypothetical protein
MNNTQTQEITWKRQPGGEYVGRLGFWVYTVFRNDRAARGHQWVLETYPEANMDDSQARRGFQSAKLAKQAARSGCFLCGRRVPFHTLKLIESRNQLSYPVWQCRDTGPCQEERDRITAERERAEAPRDYADALAEIVKLKTRVRKLETDALALRTRAIELGTSEAEIRRIEHCQGPLAGGVA